MQIKKNDALLLGRSTRAVLSTTSPVPNLTMAVPDLALATELVDQQRRAKSTDHSLDSAWLGQGSSLKQKALDQALLMVG